MQQRDPNRFDHLRPGWRSAAVHWARQMVEQPGTLWLDTETTAADPAKADLIDIAILDLRGVVLLNQLVRPPVPIPQDSIEIHGITNESVANAPTWRDLYPEVRSILSGRDVVIYNGDYDFRVIQRACKSAGLPPIEFRFQCCMLAFSDFAGEIGRYPPQRKWHKLGAAAERFGIVPPGHRAQEDAEACRLIVRAMAQES